MGTTPGFKIYEGGKYVAAVSDATLAGVLCGVIDNATVKWDGRIVYRNEDANAADSADAAAQVMLDRIAQHRRERWARQDARALIHRAGEATR